MTVVKQPGIHTLRFGDYQALELRKCYDGSYVLETQLITIFMNPVEMAEFRDMVNNFYIDENKISLTIEQANHEMETR